MDSTSDKRDNITASQAHHASVYTSQRRPGPPAANPQPVPPARLDWFHDQSPNNASQEHSKLALASSRRPWNADHSRAYQQTPWGSIHPQDNQTDVLIPAPKLDHPSYLAYRRSDVAPPHLRFAANTPDVTPYSYTTLDESQAIAPGLVNVRTFWAIADGPPTPATPQQETLENTKGDRLPATQSGPDSDEDDDLAGHALKVAMPDMEEDFHPAPHIRDTDNAQRGFISQFSPFE